MAKIADIKKGNTTLYPRTVAQAVAVSGNTLDEELSKKANTEDLVFSNGTGKYSQASYYGKNGVKTLNIASGKNAHAEGFSTTASGECSHAEGFSTTASHNQAHAEGHGTKASGSTSHAEGDQTIASGVCSHAEGLATKASGTNSHTEGWQTKATNYCEHAQGFNNISINSGSDAQKTLHSVGNGEGDDTRHNAVEVKFNGDYYIQEKTTTDDSTLKTYKAPMKRLQTWLNEKQDKLTAGDGISIDNNTISSALSLPGWITSDSSNNIIGSTNKTTKIISKDNILVLGAMTISINDTNTAIIIKANNRQAEIPLVGNEWLIPNSASYNPNGEIFNTNYSLSVYKKLIFTIDCSNCNKSNENILSIGTDITKWGYKENVKNLHIFFDKSKTNPLLVTYCDVNNQINPTNSTNTSVQNYYPVADESNIVIEFSAEGLVVDGTLLSQFTTYIQRMFMSTTTPLEFGSVQGSIRSYAVYKSVAVAENTTGATATTSSTGASGTTGTTTEI